MYLTVPPRRSSDEERQMLAAGFGWMLTPKSGLRLTLPGVWAADNGCFAQGASFDLGAFLAWLAGMRPAAGRCLFAVAPDVVGDAAATWERSREVLPELRRLGYRAALVAQDGLDMADVPWSSLDAVFIGGVDCAACRLRKSLPGMPPVSEPCRCYKWTAGLAIVAEARRRGVWSHVGRVNSRLRLRQAYQAGADSADGSYAARNPREAVTRIGGELARLHAQLPLGGVA